MNVIYIGRAAGYVRKIYRAVAILDGRRELASVIVYSHPYLEVSARNIMIPELKALRRSLDRKSYARLIDAAFSRISRVIVHPKYRGIGLGVMLVRETMPMVGTPYVEAPAVMVRYNPFFEKAGMKRIEYESKTLTKIEKFLERLEALGLDSDLLSSRAYIRRVLKRMGRGRLSSVASITCRIARSKMMNADKIRRIMKLDCDAIIEALDRIGAKPEYLIWRNPATPFPIDELLRKLRT